MLCCIYRGSFLLSYYLLRFSLLVERLGATREISSLANEEVDDGHVILPVSQ